MSIAGHSSIRRLEDVPIESAPGRSRHESVGGPRAGEIGGGLSGSPKACARRVVGAWLLIDVTAASRGVVDALMPARRGIAPRADIPLAPGRVDFRPRPVGAVREKEDIDIPLIEALELIPEPDGSPTEDFIIPDGLGERQKRQTQ